MRFIKIIGLTALSALAAMAFMAASASASNTALCKSNEAGALACAVANQVTSIHAVASGALLAPSFGGHVTCKESLAEATVLGLAAPQVAHLTALTWTGCEQSGAPCDVVTKDLGLALILKTASNLATVEFHSTNVLVECENSLHCVYGGLPKLHGLGATLDSKGKQLTNGALTASGLSLEKLSGFFCPSSALWTAEYVSLTPIYIKS